jgi:hypothetical protein
MLGQVSLAIGTVTGEWWIILPGLAVWVFVWVYFAGFLGTERLWYVAVERGVPISWSDVRGLTFGAFRGRFIRLGVLFVTLVAVPFIVALAATDSNSLERTLLVLGVVAVFDAAFTFAPAGLAFTNGTASDALWHSIAVLRAQWPKCAWYVLIPPLAIQSVLQIVPRSTLSLAVLLAFDLALAAFALLCKGATVLFYADRYPTLPS